MQGFKEFMAFVEEEQPQPQNPAPSGWSQAKQDVRQGMQQPPQGFFAGLKKGWEQGWQRTYGSAQTPTQQTLSQIPVEKYKEKANEALNKAADVYNKLEAPFKKFLPFKVMIVLIAAGIASGPMAVPTAYLAYHFKEWVKNKASNVFDKATGTGTPQKETPATQPAAPQPAPTNEIFTPASRGKLGYLAGYGAGFAGGEVASWSKKLAQALVQKSSDIKDYCVKNKIPLAKAGVLTAVGILTYGGIGLGYSALSQLAKPENLDALGNAVVDAGLATPETMQSTLGEIKAYIPAPPDVAPSASAAGDADGAADSGVNAAKQVSKTGLEFVRNYYPNPVVKTSAALAGNFFK